MKYLREFVTLLQLADIPLKQGEPMCRHTSFQIGGPVAVMVFPEGTDWGGEKVKLVIGIAGAGEEHLEILASIAEHLERPEDVERLVSCTKEEIYNTFTGKGREQ